MKYIFALLLLTSSLAFAYDESPTDTFNAEHNMTNSTSVTWIQVDNIEKTCTFEASKRGMPNFKYKMRACSFWNRSLFGHSCIIYTKHTVNYHTMGHEVRHCFAGKWAGHP